MTERGRAILRKIAAGAQPNPAPAPPPRSIPQPAPQPIHPDTLSSAIGDDIDGQSAEEWLPYEVQKGDNPTTIAKRLGVGLKPFMQWNGLNEQNSRQLRPGQNLRYRNPGYSN
jgi:hypothetical protein